MQKKLNIPQENIYNIGKKKKKEEKKKGVICAIQHTVDLINNNINRDVQEECANRLYRVCTHSSNADDGE